MAMTNRVTFRIKSNPNHVRGLVSFRNFLQALYGFYQAPGFLQKDENPEFVLEFLYNNKIGYFLLTVPVGLKEAVKTQFKSFFGDYELEEIASNWREAMWADKNVGSMVMDVDKRDCIPIINYEDNWLNYSSPADVPSKMEKDRMAQVMAGLGAIFDGTDTDLLYQVVIKPGNIHYLNQCSRLHKDLYAGRTGSKKVGGWLDKLNWLIRTVKGATGMDTSPKYYSNNVSDKTHAEAARAEEKSRKTSIFKTTVRVAAMGEDSDVLLRQKAQSWTNLLTSVFQEDSYNTLVWRENNKLAKENIYAGEITKPAIYLTADEITGLYHLPVFFEDSPRIYAFSSQEGFVLPENMPVTNSLSTDWLRENDVTLLGQAQYRDQTQYVGQKWIDRVKHTYIVGQTGTGKTTMMYDMAMSDIAAGRGVMVIDPHGDFARRLAENVPVERKNDLIYFNPAEDEHCLSLDIFEARETSNNDLLYSSLMSIFKRLFTSWGDALEYVLRNALAALLESDGASIADLPRLIEEPDFRREIMEGVKSEKVKKFWLEEFDDFMDNHQYEKIKFKIKNQLSLILSNEKLQKVLAKSEKTVRIGEVVANNKIFIANLGMGNIGEELSQLFGRMITAKLQVFAMSQSDKSIEERPRINVYLDEFQNFMTQDLFAKIISEARKFNLNLTMANQYLDQLDVDTKKALLANVGTLISFRVSKDDWYTVKSAISSELKVEDLEKLENYQAYAKVLYNNEPILLMLKTIAESELDNKLNKNG